MPRCFLPKKTGINRHPANTAPYPAHPPCKERPPSPSSPAVTSTTSNSSPLDLHVPQPHHHQYYESSTKDNNNKGGSSRSSSPAATRPHETSSPSPTSSSSAFHPAGGTPPERIVEVHIPEVPHRPSPVHPYSYHHPRLTFVYNGK